MRRTLFAIPFLFLLVFYFYPLTKITAFSLLQDGNIAVDRLIAGLISPACYKTLQFTLWQAAISTLLTLFFALPGAWLFQRYNFFGKRFLQTIMSIPFVMPTVVCAAAFESMWGNHGLINTLATSLLPITAPPLALDHSIPFFLLAHVFYNYSLALRIISSYWSGIDSRLGAAARMLGASPWQCFCKITLPLLLPAIAAASLLVFIFSFTSFGIILILGGPGHATLEVEIYRQAVQLFNLPLAASLSLVQIVINMLLMWFHARLGQNRPISFFAGEAIQGDPPRTPLARLVIAATILFILLLLAAPMASLFIASISGEEGLTLAYYKALGKEGANSLFFVPPTAAIYNSLGFAVAAMLLSLLLGLISAFFLAGTKKRASFWDTIIMLPLATSAVTLGFGYILTLNTPPLNLRNSLALLPIAHALVALPFVVRITLPAIRQIPQQLKDAATLLGASQATVLRTVELPLIRNAILIAAIFAFSVSMGEFGATSLLFRPQLPTLPMAIFRFLGLPGTLNHGQAMAMASLLMLVTGAGFFAIGSLEKKR